MSASSEQEIYDFLVDLFGDNEGVVYAPTKGATAESFIRYYFNWPTQKSEIVRHMLDANQQKKDVWVAPALLKSTVNAKKSNWLGTQFLYVDFDNGIPQSLPAGIPEPTIKIQSSIPGREHWYWKLDKFYTGTENRDMLEGLNKSLTYTLGGDTGGWDATQVLRAPGTKHRSKGVITRVLNRESSRVYNVGAFKNVLPAPPKAVLLKQQEKNLPDIIEVLSRVTLKRDALEIFNRTKEEMKPIGPGDRSAALFRFAADCLEVQPPIFKADILSMLNYLAYKWGKFDNRSDRFEQVKKVLENAIIKHDPNKVDENPADAYDAEAFRTYTELTEYIVQNPANWIMEGLLPERQTMQIVGEANIGKTSLAFRLCADIITGQDFLMWEHKAEKQHKVAYVGLDMDEGDAHDLLQGIVQTLSPEQINLFNRYFLVSSPDYGIELYDRKVQERYEETFAAHGVTLVVFDSLKDTGALEGDERRKSIFQWFKRKLMREMGLTVIVLTHTRKRDKDSKVHQTQDDVYGSGMQNADIKASLLLYKESASSSVINVNQTKVRRAKKVPVFSIKRRDDALVYEIVEEKVDTSEPSKSSGGMKESYMKYAEDSILFTKGANKDES